MTQRMALVLSFVFGCISASSTIPIQGPTIVCKGAWPVALIAQTGLLSYRWSTGETSNAIFISAQGTYTVIARRTNGSDDTGRISVREVPLPKPFIGNGPVYICPGKPVSLQPAGGFISYTWNTGEVTPIINIDSAGYYQVTVIDSNGCVGSSDSLQVIVIDRPKPTLLGAYTACSGRTMLYETDTAAGAIYTWTVVGGVLQSPQGRPTMSVRWSGGMGRIEVKVSMPRPDGGFCDTTVGFPVRVGNTLQPLLTFQKLMICEGDSTVLDAGRGFATYLWNNGATTQTVVVKTAGKYWADVVDTTGCAGASDTVTVIVFLPPDVRIAGDTSLCAGDQIVLSAFAIANDVVQWQWSNGLAQRSIIVDTPGTYTVVGRTVNGCIDSASKTVLAAAQAAITAPDSLDFDSLELGTGRFLPFLLQNRTAQIIRVLSVRLASGRTNPALSVPPLPSDIAGLGSLAFVLVWLADVEGPLVDTLLIEIDGPECLATVRIPIRGYAFLRSRVPVTISIGDTVVPVGTVLEMAIHVRAAAQRDEFVALEFSVRWNDRLYNVTGLDIASIVSDQTTGSERTVRYRFSSLHLPLDTTLTLRGTVLLGTPLQTDLTPDSVVITGKSVYLVTTDPGHIATVACFIAGRLVQFTDAQPLTLISNMLGETMQCDLEALPSGTYMISTLTGTTVHTHRIAIVR